jgi:hypothetical protein
MLVKIHNRNLLQRLDDGVGVLESLGLAAEIAGDGLSLC